jgi:hypothetical protein
MSLLLASVLSLLLLFVVDEFYFACVKLERYNLGLSHRRHVDICSLTKFVSYVDAFPPWTACTCTRPAVRTAVTLNHAAAISSRCPQNIVSISTACFDNICCYLAAFLNPMCTALRSPPPQMFVSVIFLLSNAGN